MTTSVDLDGVRSVVAVGPAPIGIDTPDGRWPCPSCDDTYAIDQGWRVTYVGMDEPRAKFIITCGACADEARERLA